MLFNHKFSSICWPFLVILSFACIYAADVGKWDRYVISFQNSTYSGNPFELEIDAAFTHTQSGTVLNLPGYFSGSDTWKIAFMPTLTGEWTYVTTSNDPELNNKTGSLTCVKSGRKGMLKADDANPRKWKYTDGDYVLPIGVFIQIMHGSGTKAQFEKMADFLVSNNLHLINFRLCEQDICFLDVTNRQMDITLWDRLEERLEILAQRDLGVDVMLYTDDAGCPSYEEKSVTEQFLVRYMIARLASFPMVFFNSGIDIWEYRGNTWHDWYGNLVKSLDPYGHPVSSRGKVLNNISFMTNAHTYNSVGARNSEIVRLIAAFNADSVPSSNNDNFGEDRTGINGHTPDDIRRAGWKALVSGGVAFHVRDNENHDCANGITKNCDMPFTVTGIQAALDSEQWLKLINPFIQNKLGATFGIMVPDQSLVSNGYALADPGWTKIVYLYMGVNDTWDSQTDSTITVKLKGVSKNFSAKWFNTKTGVETLAGTLNGNINHTLTPPNSSNEDWILFLESGITNGSE